MRSSEKDVGELESLQIGGLTEAITLLREKIVPGELTVVLIDGSAAVGKSMYSGLLASIIIPMLGTDDVPTNISTSFQSERGVDPSPEEQAEKGILNLDLFYSDRESEIRKESTNLFEWFRKEVLEKTVVDIVERGREILKKGREVEKKVPITFDAYIRGEGVEEKTFLLNLESEALIIEGLGSMNLIPDLSEPGINIVSIAVTASKLTRREWAINRSESRRKDVEDTKNGLDLVTEPSWEEHCENVVIDNADIIVKSSYGQMNMVRADSIDENELRYLLS